MLDEPLYQYLIDTYEKLGKKLNVQLIYYSDDISEIPKWDQFDKKQNNLIIFDDLINEKNLSVHVADLFTMGRKAGSGISCLFLSQSYFAIPLKIRQNSDYVFILRVNSQKDLQRILSQYQLGVSLDQLNEMYRIATKKRGNFLLLDVKSNTEEAMRYRANFAPFQINDGDNDEDEEDD
jgi:hypothetical protein